ncbi:hypothetical protein AUEXF2481DRAFT_533208 [Aureobasidium subglaciale EXF-2481]|uniref:Uncharacterized protein n=1 Tax=Aureobasidium subglaciale (strain EXF-2481) TaxID=1043005 RepID=A0A074XZ07_AURSE|nr:uncharacterized protein AUEXF2481DRAFT_533208 [Aureobasidium subglaciale EXF-2481]KEQ90665.1 hypothetical protein AUEXF2481DRAFT_533208 [Aureobasidium subglaciale EXF-2481]
MAGLVELPLRIPDRFFTELLKSCLAACALVSTAWISFFAPLVYRNIELIWRRPRSICSIGSHGNTHPLPCPCEICGSCDARKKCEPRFRGASSCLKPIHESKFNIP